MSEAPGCLESCPVRIKRRLSLSHCQEVIYLARYGRGYSSGKYFATFVTISLTTAVYFSSGCNRAQENIPGSLSQKVPLFLRERVGVTASERRSRSSKPAAIRAIFTPEPSPAERVNGDYGIGIWGVGSQSGADR